MLVQIGFRLGHIPFELVAHGSTLRLSRADANNGANARLGSESGGGDLKQGHDEDTMRREYDFSSGIGAKHHEVYHRGPNRSRWSQTWPRCSRTGHAAGGSIWPKVQNLLLAARALQLGACPTNLPLFGDWAAAYEALNVPANMELACVIPVGYPMGRFGPVTQRPVQEVVSWNQFGD